MEIITPQARPLNFLIASINYIHLRNTFKWQIQDQTCNFLTSTPSLNVEHLSNILSTVRLGSASILHQGKTITNSFSYKIFMYPLLSMIITAIMMRIKPCEFYHVLHHTCAGTLCTKIFSLNTYTRHDYIQKYRVFIKLFFMDMSNSINAYHPHIH